MQLKIKIHPSSSQEKILRISECEFEVWIKEKPIDGKANDSLEKFLKNYFKSKVKVIHGFTSRNKIVEVED